VFLLNIDVKDSWSGQSFRIKLARILRDHAPISDAADNVGVSVQHGLLVLSQPYIDGAWGIDL
jgi:hypothetical protein